MTFLNDLYTNSYKSLKMYNHAVHDEKIEYFHIRSFFYDRLREK